MLTRLPRRFRRQLSTRVLAPLREMEREDQWEARLVALTAVSASVMVLLLRVWS
ncbi:MAG: hypothetical protein SFV15_07675 [Polyangiaceae bacterium]|nr:hypothetical protein [Polyangiaceae bacterium]